MDQSEPCWLFCCSCIWCRWFFWSDLNWMPVLTKQLNIQREVFCTQKTELTL